MYEWCHSGIEGYCKAASIVLAAVEADRLTGADEESLFAMEAGKLASTDADKPAGEDEEKPAGVDEDGHVSTDADKPAGTDEEKLVAGFCQELFPGRGGGDVLSRTWTLSNGRTGKDTRLTLFEKAWLDMTGKTFVAEAKAYGKGKVSKKGYPTVEEGSQYANDLRAAKNDDARASLALNHWTREAVNACVNDILRRSGFGDALAGEGEAYPFVTKLVGCHNFPELFLEQVAPAIERGFLSERYRWSEVQQFIVTLTKLLESANLCAQEGEGSGKPYREFLETLVAGIIYGPTHPMAMRMEWDPTSDFFAYNGRQTLEYTGVRITQIFDAKVRLTGYSELVRSSQVVFFGRSPKAEDYLDRLNAVIGRMGARKEDERLFDHIVQLEHIVFPMTLQDMVSGCHAMLVCEGRQWYLYDLESTNGTVIESDGKLIKVGSGDVLRINPGDRVHLGSPAEADDMNVYWNAATIVITFNVDRNTELV